MTTITKLVRSPEGYWTANVSVDGATVPVDRKFGSWQADVRVAPNSREFKREFVLPPVAAKLQEKVRPLEKRGL